MKDEEYAAFFSDFIEESDRAAILLGASWLDELLLQILKKRLMPQKKEFFDYQGPIGTFSSRIDMAHAVGTITKQYRTRLHLVRKIRNACAHNIQKVNLSAKPISDLLPELVMGFDKNKFWKSFFPQLNEGFKLTQNQLALRFAIACMVADLNLVSEKVKRIDESEQFSLMLLQPEN